MFVEITAAVQSATALWDLIRANKILADSNELVSAVAEVNTNLMAAQTVTLASQEKQAALIQKIGELEKEIVKLKDWNRERERYQLTTFTTGAFAYALKPGMENGQPPHHLCARCYRDPEKPRQSILQPSGIFHECPECKTRIQTSEMSFEGIADTTPRGGPHSWMR